MAPSRMLRRRLFTSPSHLTLKREVADPGGERFPADRSNKYRSDMVSSKASGSCS